jgi:hypothetical protein
MSFPIRTVHLPSPLHQRCWPSPPPSECDDNTFSSIAQARLRSPSLSSPSGSSSRHRSSSSGDIAYFPVVPSTPPINDSHAYSSFNCPSNLVSSKRLALAWAIVRLRHPILASIGLMDAFGKVSYSYDPPFDTDSAILDAEASSEHRRCTTPSDLLASYQSSTRRVSRSHLSHLLFATSPAGTLISPPPSPPLPSRDSPVWPVHEHTVLLCTPHYVTDEMTLKSFIDEFIALLTQHMPHSEDDLPVVLQREWRVAASKQPPILTLKPISPVGLKMRLPPDGRFLRTVAAS